MNTFSRFDIFLVSLTSAESNKIRKPQPCVIVSPEELNKHLRTITIAPLRNKGRAAPFRLSMTIDGDSYQIATDQLRSIDKTRLLEKISRVSPSKSEQLCKILQDMFALN